MIRKCPLCDTIITHTNINSFKRAVKNLSNCKTCTGKLRLGNIVSDETKYKMSLNHHDVSGINNPMFGKTSALKNKKWSDFRNKDSVTKSKKLLSKGLFLNKKHSKETKNKLSLKSMGENNRFYGKKHTEETKNILREKTLEMFKNGKIKNINTSIEITVKNILDNLGINYRQQEIFGFWSFDFYIPKYNLFIECDGDYWHGNPNLYNVFELNKTQLKNITNGRAKDNFVVKNNQHIVRLWETEIRNEKLVISILNKEFDKVFIHE